MVISSRTPEGRMQHCEVCQQGFVLEPSCIGHDATCPHCGTLAWFDASCPIMFDDPRPSYGPSFLRRPGATSRRERRRSEPTRAPHHVSLIHACWTVMQKAWTLLNQPLMPFGGTTASKA